MTKTYIPRKVELRTDRGFTVIHFDELKKYDIFRIFEPDGNKEPVTDANGYSLYMAYSDAYVNEEGVGEIQTKVYNLS